jgi:hypothetical protein
MFRISALLHSLAFWRFRPKYTYNNGPSNRAARHYGYSFEVYFRQHGVTAKVMNRDTNWYSIIDSEWEQRKAALEAWLDPNKFDEDGMQNKRLEEFHVPTLSFRNFHQVTRSAFDLKTSSSLSTHYPHYKQYTRQANLSLLATPRHRYQLLNKFAIEYLVRQQLPPGRSLATAVVY